MESKAKLLGHPIHPIGMGIRDRAASTRGRLCTRARPLPSSRQSRSVSRLQRSHDASHHRL